MLAVSLSWVALYTFTPASDRPYVDGSTDNSAIAMVFGYNGLERFGISVKGAVTSGPGVTTSGTGASRPGATATGNQANSGGTGASETAPSGAAAGGTAPAGGAPGGTAPTAGTGGAGGTGGPSGTTGTTGTTGAAAAPGFGGGGGAGGSSFGSGWTKLLGSEYGPEIGWLYPLAVLAVVFGLAWTRRAKRADRARAGFVMWGLWLASYGLIFSKMSMIPHTAYMSSLAPPLAALPAAGIVMFWRAFRAGGGRAWVLPAAVAAELAWALFLWHYYPGFLPWARDAIAAVGVVAIVALVAARLSRRARVRLVTVGLAGGVAAMIAAPGAWAASVLDTTYGGSSFNASAGPAGGFGGGGAGGGGAPAGGLAAAAGRYSGRGTAGGDRTGNPGGDRTTTGFPAGAGAGAAVGGGGAGGGITASATTTLTSAEQQIYNYVSAHRDGAGYLLAVGSWEEAGQYILATGQEVMDLGGFSGSVPSPTLAQVKNLVQTGQLKFFLVSGSGGGAGFGAGGGESTATAIDSWVSSACTPVPAKDYSSGAATAAASTGTLYACGRDA
jgi:hypothetical protein